MDLLDISNMKSRNFKNSPKKIVQESEENRLDNFSDDDKEKNSEQFSTSQFNLEKDNNKKYKKIKTKLPMFDVEGIKIKTPMKNYSLN